MHGQPIISSRLTFLPPEDVLSGFTESLFSLLEDLERLVFSFSADSGPSGEGLELLLFFSESAGEEGELRRSVRCEICDEGHV